MADNPNNIAKVRKSRALSQQQLAERVGAHTITISNLERGQIPLTEDWLRRLSEALQVEDLQLLKMERPLKVFVGAEVSASRLVFWESETGFFTPDSKFAVAIAQASPASADLLRWAVVNDDSFYPVFRAFDVIRLVPVLEHWESEIVWARGRLCFVISDDTNELFCGYIHHSSTVGSLSLDTIRGPSIKVPTPHRIFVVDRAIYQPNFPSRDEG